MNNQLYDNQPRHIRQDIEYDKPIGSYIKPVKKEKRTPIVFRVIGVATLFGIVAALAFMLTTMFGGALGDAIFPSDNGEIAELFGQDRSSEEGGYLLEQEGSLELTRSVGIITTDVSEIVEFAMPSVVSITNLTAQQTIDFFGGSQVYETASAGSGFIVAIDEEELLIVTNDHVVAGHETLFITFIDETVLEAYIKGTKPEYDLAVVAVPISRITRETMNTISIATIGDSDTLRMGEPAIAIGNALGYGQTVTMGVISALNRVSTAVNREQHVEFANVELIQTDAAINPGNSGGPLMNARGEVIGINSSKLVGYQIEGVGYAIPISDVTWIINDLMNRATRVRVQEDLRGFLGISGSSVTANMATQHDMPQGVLINEIIEGGGAEGAGLEAGSIITELEGQTITSMQHLQWELDFYTVGEIVEVVVYRRHNEEYIREVVSVQLGDRP
jgi:serine protease Do